MKGEKKRYALCVRELQGDKFPRARFVFQAESDEQAEREGLKWGIYHGLNYRLDIVVRPISPSEAIMQIHNDYLIK